MLILGHTAATTLAARWADERVDLRWVIFLTLFADLVDKPLGLVIFRETINNGRVYFHSLFVNLLLTVLLVVLRRPLVYSLALWMHLLCDRMWMRPGVALWPFAGAFGYRDLPFQDWVYSVLNPYNLTTEAVGLVVLVALVVKHRLYQRRRLKAWIRTGRLREVTPTVLSCPAYAEASVENP